MLKNRPEAFRPHMPVLFLHIFSIFPSFIVFFLALFNSNTQIYFWHNWQKAQNMIQYTNHIHVDT